ncbi:hypothetical protein ACOMHN_026567 [Nucella lapillus]
MEPTEARYQWPTPRSPPFVGPVMVVGTKGRAASRQPCRFAAPGIIITVIIAIPTGRRAQDGDFISGITSLRAAKTSEDAMVLCHKHGPASHFGQWAVLLHNQSAHSEKNEQPA